MLMRTRPLAALIVSALFSLQVACSSQETTTEESIQPVGEEAPADAPTDAENTGSVTENTEKTEADIEKEKAIAEASGSDFTDPSQVQLNGDGSPATPVDPVDTTGAPAMSDIPAPEAPMASDMGLDAGLGAPASGSVYFAKASAKVSREYREQLKDIAAKLKADRSMKVVLVGHCDNRGSTAFNRRLANKRAKAVKAALMKMGVKSRQMSIGAPQLAQSGSTEEEHAQNRRVEIQ
ncbi:MAG TPA: OmpA family protein [Oligoflexus sp.]|uniref:OmpA family protein n=1 Tax=Oligoflexus sp. TaxID=1971216 RepID=UPI002D802FA3|nr:OmpA family protein [Oligoflexus sp.]HET9236052.1 OmpA family protein [Oligoflexus sp.]